MICKIIVSFVVSKKKFKMEKKVTTSEPRKESINIKELPGLKPKDIDYGKIGEWNKKYMNLSDEKKNY